MNVAAVDTGMHISCVTLIYFPLDIAHRIGVTGMSPEDIMLCRVSQTQKDKYRMFSFMCGNFKLDLIDLDNRIVVPGRDSYWLQWMGRISSAFL